MTEILRAGVNCWRTARARRAAFIIDGDRYFRAVREAVCRAERFVYIIGWHVHNEVHLVREDPNDGFPTRLGELLDAVAQERRDLHIYVLEWDFSMIYAMERDFLPRYRLRWRSHDRVHFLPDGEHPVGASQHQKVVVVDDCIAFCGGIDLSKWRWDTSRHEPDDTRRIDPNGDSYPPFHDVQMLVDGEAAKALGDLARARWYSASAEKLWPSESAAHNDPWPSSVAPALEAVDIGISRTYPPYDGREEIREVEHLYVDSIAAAQRFIYAENQYLSSHRVGQALAARLREENGPEVVLVMPAQTGGWLEQHTMDVLRGRVLRSLRDADRHRRLRVYFVQLSEEPDVALMVHAKVMIIDDSFVRVGSSNISNRSMGLDSECDLAIESSSEHDRKRAIAQFRRELLAEHLGVTVESVSEAEERHASLIEAIESLRGGVRSLRPLSGKVSPEVDEWVPDSTLLDPERPVDPTAFFDYFVDPSQRRTLSRGLLKLGTLLFVLLALAAAWRWTPLADWLSFDEITAAARWIDAQPATPFLVLAAYVITGLAAVPITVMIVATVVVFGPWLGMAYGFAGSELAAVVEFGLGSVLGRGLVARLGGGRFNHIRRALGERGMLTIVMLRIVPVAPFTFINVVAGMSEIRFRDFAVGTLLGMVPGVVAIGLLTDRIVASIRQPSTISILVAAVVGILVAASLIGLRRWFRRHAEG